MNLPSPLPRSLVLGLGFPVVVLNLWVFSSLYRAFEGVASTFILAGVIALILNLPVRLLQRRLGLQRGWAIGAVFLLFIGGAVLASATVIPLLLLRFIGFTQALPEWIDSSVGKLVLLSGRANEAGLPLDASVIIEGVAANVKDQIESVLLGIPGFISGSLGSFFSLFFLLVLIIFFLIYGGELVRNCLVSWLPGDRGLQVLSVLRRNFNSYIFNQLVLAIVLVCALTPALVVLQAPFPILSGCVIGLMGFIPFGAILGILLVSVLFLFKSFWLGVRVFSVLILLDQVIENILPPRLLGKLTGLNPIVILFSVMVGATLADFYGVITAVPIAATIKALFLAPSSLPATATASAALPGGCTTEEV
ncbi:AI-2E family transporter [Synechococcus sp. CCY9202]|uniref:AI-2E family transporter n=1 Tax=Synechococcus sp. CCY9202 TaxID=174698 RepID=UPI002B214D56|nr:AI-2E family transporter [Synechococcus sp. CCY9202]MEA5423350.1 AI-2E family transporter [Synechococcus sp. CCY9202]